MNVYTTTVRLPCKNNGLPIDYFVKIRSLETIMVEDINAFLLRPLRPLVTGATEGIFHETLADDLYDRFGGQQTIKAMHHGVKIKTTRGSL